MAADQKPKQEAVLQALRAGNTFRAAAHYAGVDEATVWRWRQADANFRNAVQKAESDAEIRHVANIAKAAADGNWQASAWWLERKRHEDWGRKDTLALKLSRMSREQLVEYVAEDFLAAGIDLGSFIDAAPALTEGEALSAGAPEGAADADDPPGLLPLPE